MVRETKNITGRNVLHEIFGFFTRSVQTSSRRAFADFFALIQP